MAGSDRSESITQNLDRGEVGRHPRVGSCIRGLSPKGDRNDRRAVEVGFRRFRPPLRLCRERVSPEARSRRPPPLRTYAGHKSAHARVRRVALERNVLQHVENGWGIVAGDEETYLQALGRRLRELRHLSGLSQAALARTAGLARSTVER